MKMDLLKLLERAINELAYKRAMEKINKRKFKTWGRLGKKLEEFTKIEKDKVITHITFLIVKGRIK